MKRTAVIPMALVAGAMTAARGVAQTSLTIYSDGRVLERRMLDLAVPAGFSSHRLALGPLDVGSLFGLDSGVVVTGASYEGAVDEQNALRRAVGRRIGFLVRPATGPAETIQAEVLGVDPERFRLADGTVVFQRPGIPVFPPELAPSGPSLLVGIRSERARQRLGLGYFSGGASWRAGYTFLLGRGTARASGHATVSAGSLRADSAEVQLLAGSVGRAAGKEGFQAEDQVRLQARVVAQAAAQEQAVGEAHLYTLPNRLSFTPGIETSALLFEPAVAAYERTYTVRGQIPYWGGLPQLPEETEEPVKVTYVIRRQARTEFGDRPLPGGVARIYEPDGSGRPQMVGETSFGHTAAGQDLRVEAGTAFDLTARRVQSEYTTQRERNRTVATAGYTVTVSNAKDSAVAVDVLEQRAGEWSVISSSVPAERLSSTVTRFRIRVPARGQASVDYRVRVVW